MKIEILLSWKKLVNKGHTRNVISDFAMGKKINPGQSFRDTPAKMQPDAYQSIVRATVCRV